MADVLSMSSKLFVQGFGTYRICLRSLWKITDFTSALSMFVCLYIPVYSSFLFMCVLFIVFFVLDDDDDDDDAAAAADDDDDDDFVVVIVVVVVVVGCCWLLFVVCCLLSSSSSLHNCHLFHCSR